MTPSIKKSAKHTRNSFDDQIAVSLLSALVASSRRAMPDLKANDKYPNIDGYIELTDINGYHGGTIKAQVKKLSTKTIRTKKFRFRNEKFLSYCSETQDWIPIFFIGVDITQKEAYWVHMTNETVSKYHRNKYLTIDPQNLINDSSFNYIDEWVRISNLYSTKSIEFEKYKKAFSVLSDVITPALGISDESFIKIHKFLDKLNYCFDVEFPSIKKLYYPNCWKLGFAYYNYSPNSVSYTTYPIPLQKNDVQIKCIEKSLYEMLNDINFEFNGHFQNNPIEDNPERFALDVLADKVKQVTKGNQLEITGIEYLAREYIFAFIEDYHTQMGLNLKDEYSKDELKYGFKKYLPVWLVESYRYMITDNKNHIKERFARKRYLDPDHLWELNPKEQKQISDKVETILSNDTPSPSILMGSNKFSFRLFDELINSLEEGSSIKRLYKRYSVDNDNLTELQTEFEYNFNLFFKELPHIYDSFVELNFPKIKSELNFWQGVDLIQVQPEKITDMDAIWRGDIKVAEYSAEIKNAPKVILFSDFDSENLNDWSKKKYEFDGKKYLKQRVYYRSLRFMWRETPMLNYIHELIGERLASYIKTKD